jgi:Cu-Zn family superoxide dismutase
VDALGGCVDRGVTNIKNTHNTKDTNHTKKQKEKRKKKKEKKIESNQKDSMDAVAVFPGQNGVFGDVVFHETPTGVSVHASFSALPHGEHGFHIHSAGDLRGQGCKGACDHYHVGPPSNHGGSPSHPGQRHTGDLGNIVGPSFSKRYFLRSVRIADLYGRSVIVHQDPDDLGKGNQEDSLTTGHSGKRIACAVIGRSNGKN